MKQTTVVLCSAALFATVLIASCVQSNNGSAERGDTALPAAYTVTFDKNAADATGTMASQTFTSGVRQTLSAHAFQRDGYVFAGWAESAGGKKKYGDKQEISVTGDCTLYALWTAVYTVTFNSNGGSAVPAQHVESGATASVPLYPTKSGYTVFDTWYTDNALTKPFDFTTPVTQNMTLYAKWLRVAMNKGSDINEILKALNADSEATSFKFSATEPPSISEAKKLSTNLSEIDVYAWREGTAIYCYAKGVTGTSKKLPLNEDSSELFANCTHLADIDVSGFDTSNVKNMESMFFTCTALTTLDVRGFDTSNVTNMRSMFMKCTALTTVDVSSFNTSNVTAMENMFTECRALTQLDVHTFDMSNIAEIESMFMNCSALTTIYAKANTNWVAAIQVLSSGENMFLGCTNLKGGNGTEYDSSNVDIRYARIDSDTSKGYFTAVANRLNP